MSNQTETPPLFCRMVDESIVRIGRILAWFNVALIFDIIIQVILRYGFGHGSVGLEESQWHLYAVAIMFGISYDVVLDSHIRLDVFQSRFSPRKKEWVEFLGILFLLLPLVTVLFLHGLDFTASAWRVSETSDSPMGLPYRWAIKAVVPASMFLFWLASVSRLIKSARFLFGRKS